MASTDGRPISAFRDSGVPSATILPVVDDPDPVGQHVGLLEVLGGEEDGHAVVARQPRDLGPQVGAAGGVEARWSARRGTARAGEWTSAKRQVEPALHAARVAADLAVRGLGEPDALEQLVAARAPLRLRHALQRRLQTHVIAAREQRVERRLLQRGADRRPHRGTLAQDVVAGHARRARGGRQQRGEHQHRGRLARAVGPEEAVDLAGRDLQVDPVDGPRAVLELADQTLEPRCPRWQLAT